VSMENIAKRGMLIGSFKKGSRKTYFLFLLLTDVFIYNKIRKNFFDGTIRNSMHKKQKNIFLKT